MEGGVAPKLKGAQSGHGEEKRWEESDELEYVMAEKEILPEDPGQHETMDGQQLMDMIKFEKDTSHNVAKWRLVAIQRELSVHHGFAVIIRAAQELRKKRRGPVAIGIGGPSGSGVSSLAESVAKVLEGIVLPQAAYYHPQRIKDDVCDPHSLDFPLLQRHLQDLLTGKAVDVPEFDFAGKKRSGFRNVAPPPSGVVLLEGIYALHQELLPYLDISVAVVGGVHYNLLTKVRRDLRMGQGGSRSCQMSPEEVIDSIFPLFRQHIEPTLVAAQVRISNDFVADSLREPLYILKSSSPVSPGAIAKILDPAKHPVRHEVYLDMYLRPPHELAKPSDWIRMRQAGIRYYLTEGQQRIVDHNFIIRPRIEFEVGKMTLGGLLDCNYNIAVSFKRESQIYGAPSSSLIISVDTIDQPLQQTFVQLKGTNRQVVQSAAAALGLEGSWITKSYMEMVLDLTGMPRLPSPPLSISLLAQTHSTHLPPVYLAGDDALTAGAAEPHSVLAPIPFRPQPVTQQVADSVTGSWQLTSLPSGSTAGGDSIADVATSDTGLGDDLLTGARPSEASRTPLEPGDASRDMLPGNLRVELLPKPEHFSFDKGLVLAVQAAQTLLNKNGPPVLIGIGGPSGSGKSSLAKNMGQIMGCQVISLEGYLKEEEVDDTNYDDFSTLDCSLLLQNLRDMRELRLTQIPRYDRRTRRRHGFIPFSLLGHNGVVIIEGTYALHQSVQHLLDIRIAVVGGVHSHLVARVQHDLEKAGRAAQHRAVTSTLFPLFREQIEPQLASAHLKIRNNFDPAHSRDNCTFVLKSSKEVSMEEIARVLSPERSSCTTTFTDIYFYLPGITQTGPSNESDWIRVRNSDGRFAILIREPIREGDFIIQPQVDFDISVRTVAGLLSLGYQAAAYLAATATFHQDDTLVVEVDHLQKMAKPFIQIKGTSRDAVAAAGAALRLDGTYTTLPYIEIIQRHNQVALVESADSLQAARLQEILHRVASRDGRPSSAGNGRVVGEASTIPEIAGEELKRSIASLELRILHLELWQMLSTVFFGATLVVAMTFLFTRPRTTSR